MRLRLLFLHDLPVSFTTGELSSPVTPFEGIIIKHLFCYHAPNLLGVRVVMQPPDLCNWHTQLTVVCLCCCGLWYVYRASLPQMFLILQGAVSYWQARVAVNLTSAAICYLLQPLAPSLGPTLSLLRHQVVVRCYCIQMREKKSSDCKTTSPLSSAFIYMLWLPQLENCQMFIQWKFIIWPGSSACNKKEKNCNCSQCGAVM